MARKGRNGIKGLSRALERVPAESVEGIVGSFTAAGELEASRALGGSASMSPNGNGPYPLLVKVDRVKSTKARTSVVLFGSRAGFWTWIEDGVRTHPVKPKKRATKTGRPAAMGGGLSHPIGGTVQRGMVPRRAWTKTVERADADVEAVVLSALDDVLEG